MGKTLLRPPRRQHTVSKVVLRQFTRHGQISVYDRAKDSIYCKGPNGVFFDDLDRHDPIGAEQRWGEVEREMPRVYALIRARTVLEDAAALDTLRALLALHWIRTPALREAHERAKAHVAAQSIARLDGQPDILAAAFTQRTGLVPGSYADLAWVNRALHRDVLAATKNEMLSGSLARLYAGALEFVAKWQIHVGYSRGLDFIIGDAPVITVKADHDGVGFHQGVALGDAVEMTMPIAPDVIIGASPAPALLEVDDSAVLRYNALQVQSFVRHLAAVPGGVSDGHIRAHSGASHIYPPHELVPPAAGTRSKRAGS